jgi:hypothetical protein
MKDETLNKIFRRGNLPPTVADYLRIAADPAFALLDRLRALDAITGLRPDTVNAKYMPITAEQVTHRQQVSEHLRIAVKEYGQPILDGNLQYTADDEAIRRRLI